jgi:C4-dicarboxylate-specific signal transduction histidine kinase
LQVPRPAAAPDAKNERIAFFYPQCLRRPERRRLKQVDLNALVEKQLATHGERAKMFGVLLSTELSQELPHLAASSIELSEALRHVVNNALGAMDYGGCALTVRTLA